MATVRFKANRGGIRRLLSEPGVAADLARRAQAVAESAGPGHIVRTDIGKVRARSAVITATARAANQEARNRNLTRAVDAAR